VVRIIQSLVKAVFVARSKTEGDGEDEKGDGGFHGIGFGWPQVTNLRERGDDSAKVTNCRKWQVTPPVLSNFLFAHLQP